MESGIITLVSVAVNALVAVFAPVIAKRLIRQQERLRRAEETLGTVGTGLQVIEKAVEENKDALSGTGAGDAIAKTIRDYGPAAKQLVDTARTTAAALRQSAQEAYEQEAIAREVKEHGERQTRELRTESHGGRPRTTTRTIVNGKRGRVS